MRTRISAVVVALTLFQIPALAQLDKILGNLGGRGSTVSDSKAASGLKQALQIGTDHAVDLTGVTDGFFRNEAIKILMPPKLRSAEKAMRMVGMGPKIDEFTLSMNRAAEAASPAARGIFKKALLNMTFADAKQILTGGDTSATNFFKEKTTGELKVAFKPAVQTAMGNTGVVKQYNQLTKGLQSLPFGRGIDMDISDYVVGKTLDGLFFMVAQEEKKIRTNPAAQITPLLKEVFGGLKR